MLPKPETQQPLLTVAIPTYKRAADLARLLSVLLPQAAALPQVEVFISNNASPDNTEDVTRAAEEAFAAAGAHLRVYRHSENIGSDANFASCFRMARGRFFWMCGDDDVIVPGALAEVVSLIEATPDLDMIYATSYGFRSDWQAERQGDPMGRSVHTLRSAKKFAMAVNIMFSFISGMVVNRDRILTEAREQPEDFIGTNLVQLSWSLPLLLNHHRSLILWNRPVGAQTGAAHGYSLGSVFGEKLRANVERLLPGRKDLQSAILNTTLRRWFPSILLDVRGYPNQTLGLAEAHEGLKRAFGSNPRYWLFTYPALKLPLPAAKLYTKATAVLSKLIYTVHLPGFWRKRT